MARDTLISFRRGLPVLAMVHSGREGACGRSPPNVHPHVRPPASLRRPERPRPDERRGTGRKGRVRQPRSRRGRSRRWSGGTSAIDPRGSQDSSPAPASLVLVSALVSRPSSRSHDPDPLHSRPCIANGRRRFSLRGGGAPVCAVGWRAGRRMGGPPGISASALSGGGGQNARLRANHLRRQDG